MISQILIIGIYQWEFQMHSKKNILVLAAHPDDETLGCGATIARLSDEGHNIQLLTFTDGVSSRNVDGNRNDVLGKVKNILGLSSYYCGNFPDNKMDSVPLLDVCKFIEENVKVKPDIIFTHHKGCGSGSTEIPSTLS